MCAIGLTGPEEVNKTKTILNFKKRKKKDNMGNKGI